MLQKLKDMTKVQWIKLGAGLVTLFLIIKELVGSLKEARLTREIGDLNKKLSDLEVKHARDKADKSERDYRDALDDLNKHS